ncbi:hypothetical protein JCM10212_002114 [Sporobolomyces blumeae]
MDSSSTKRIHALVDLTNLSTAEPHHLPPSSLGLKTSSSRPRIRDMIPAPRGEQPATKRRAVSIHLRVTSSCIRIERAPFVRPNTGLPFAKETTQHLRTPPRVDIILKQPVDRTELVGNFIAHEFHLSRDNLDRLGFLIRPSLAVDGKTNPLLWNFAMPGRVGSIWEGAVIRGTIEFDAVAMRLRPDQVSLKRNWWPTAAAPLQFTTREKRGTRPEWEARMVHFIGPTRLPLRRRISSASTWTSTSPSPSSAIQHAISTLAASSADLDPALFANLLRSLSDAYSSVLKSEGTLVKRDPDAQSPRQEPTPPPRPAGEAAVPPPAVRAPVEDAKPFTWRDQCGIALENELTDVTKLIIADVDAAMPKLDELGILLRPFAKEGKLDLMEWTFALPGRAGTEWAGSLVKGFLTFPPEYPLQMPKLKTSPPLFHPNVWPSGRFGFTLHPEKVLLGKNAWPANNDVLYPEGQGVGRSRILEEAEARPPSRRDFDDLMAARRRVTEREARGPR